MKYTLHTLLILLIHLSLSAQTVVMKPFETKMAAGTDEHLKQYKLLRLNVETLADQINAISGNVKEITLRTADKTWQLQLFEYAILSPDYKRYTGGIGDITILPKRNDFRTFKGNIKGQNGSQVNLSMADGFFSLMIVDNGERFFIEPLDLTSLNPTFPATEQYLMYSTNDIVPHAGMKCGADLFNKELQSKRKAVEQKQVESRLRPCRLCAEVKICLAADLRMYIKYGSNIMNTENQMLTIMADVQTVYDDEFANEYEYVVTGTYVPEIANKDPFNTSTTLAAMLTRFAQIGDALFSNSQFSVATVWTARFTDPLAEVGTAFQGTLCMNERFNVCSDFWPAGGRQGDYLTLQAHMIGHNWNMIHDIATSPCIMKPGYINGSTCWSFLSIASLNQYATDNKLIETMCLLLCPGTDAPVPDFASDITFGCQPVTVHFTDLSLNATQWKWRFPGGIPDSSTLKNPTVVYKTVGIFPVTLEAGNSRCDMSVVRTDYIEIHDLPYVDFGFGVNPDKSVYFTDFSQRGFEYLWKFGDNEESDEQFPTHVYDRDSTYEVSFTVTNDCGSKTVKKKVVVVSLPIADFEADTTAGCTPKIIHFLDKSTNNVIKWEWKFPGGNPSISNAQNPFVRYDNPGVFDAELIVYSAKNTHGLKRKLYIKIDSLPDAEFTYSINGNTVNFDNQSKYANSHLWIFGDPGNPNNTSTEAKPSHTFLEGRFEVLYIAINSCGSDTARTILTIGSKPIAGFQVADTKGCIPYQVQFTNTSTAAATAFRWYFPGGNPSTSTDKNPLITYNSVGKFDVSLFAYNNFFSDSVGLSNFITVIQEPVAGFVNTISGFKVNFTSQSTGATNYFWDFGDGSPGFVENPVHDYGVEGEFKVRLVVENECGLDTFDKLIAVYIVPKVDFRADTIRGCEPFKVKFSDRSSIDIVEWDWQFENGNPTTSKDKNPEVIFKKKGRYTVKLTVKNTNGSNALTKTQYIQVLSTIYCPEKTKNPRFTFSDSPFGGEIIDRFVDSNQDYPLVYPNPASDYLYVLTDASNEHPVDLKIYDLSGRLLSQHRTADNEYRISITNMKSGSYLMRINDGQQSLIRKFVIAE